MVQGSTFRVPFHEKVQGSGYNVQGYLSVIRFSVLGSAFRGSKV